MTEGVSEGGELGGWKDLRERYVKESRVKMARERRELWRLQ